LAEAEKKENFGEERGDFGNGGNLSTRKKNISATPKDDQNPEKRRQLKTKRTQSAPALPHCGGVLEKNRKTFVLAGILWKTIVKWMKKGGEGGGVNSKTENQEFIPWKRLQSRSSKKKPKKHRGGVRGKGVWGFKA